MQRDREAGMYVYRAVQDGEEFVGLVCCVGTEDYENRTIRRHELTRYDKEEDRTRHIDVVGANTGLVFLLYRDPGGEIFSHVRSLIDGVQPDGSTTTASGVLHEVYRIADEAALARLESLFAGGVPETYIADGHHRAKSAVNVAERRRSEGGRFTEEAGKFMVVFFAHDRVRIHGYSRLVTDLGGDYTPGRFLEALPKAAGLSALRDDRRYGLPDPAARCPGCAGARHALLPRGNLVRGLSAGRGPPRRPDRVARRLGPPERRPRRDARDLRPPPGRSPPAPLHGRSKTPPP